MSDVSPLSGISGLSFDSTLLSPLLFFCLVLLPFLSYRFREDIWSVVCAAYCHMTLVFAVMHLYNILEFFIDSVHSFFLLF